MFRRRTSHFAAVAVALFSVSSTLSDAFSAKARFYGHPNDARTGTGVQSSSEPFQDCASASDRRSEGTSISPDPVALAALALAVSLPFVSPFPAHAISGGGLDYANMDITGKNFGSSSDYKGKDFSQVIAKGTNFAGSNLQGCRFYKAYLVNADFTGADLRGAGLEDLSMDGATFKNADVRGAYIGQSILDAGNLEGADFTDAQLPVKTLPLVCEREDVKGINPKTGADTRESLMCP